MSLKEDLLLYAVTDRHYLHDKTLEEAVKEAIDGGITFVQLREKNMDHEDFKEEALRIQSLCHQYQIPFVIDDDVDLAVEICADDVHVGQSDLEALEARKKIGSDKILGVSAGTVEEAIKAEKAGADYLGVGAVFPTGSKDDATPVSHDTLKAICNAVSIPVIAIGGITRDNVRELEGTGIVGIAVISAIFAKDNITSATEDLLQKTKEAIL